MEEIQDRKLSPSPSPLQPAAAAAEEALSLPSLCQECSEKPFKYRCPGCSLRTCSLPCVKSHKQRTNCSGKRDRTHFVPLSEFNDSHLISDYNLLEETKRVAESARKLRHGLIGDASFRLPWKAKDVRRVAHTRKTNVLLLPVGMTLRKKNRSFYNHRKKSIHWTVEWCFHSTDVVLIDHGVDEHKKLRPLIENHLKIDDSWNTQREYKLRPFRKELLGNLKFFIRERVKGAESPFRELDISASLGNQLAGITLLEFPIIHVVLPLHFNKFGVSNCAKPDSKSVPAESLNGLPRSLGMPSNEKAVDKDSIPLEESCSCPVVSGLPESSCTDILPIEGESESLLGGGSHGVTVENECAESADCFPPDIQDPGVNGSDSCQVQSLDCGFFKEEESGGMRMLQDMSSFYSEGKDRGDLTISDDTYIGGGENLEEGEIAEL